MTVLVTGGAGYIGSHVARKFLETEETTLVLDDLSTGHHEFTKGLTFVQQSVLDTRRLEQVIREWEVDAIIHLAGVKAASRSVQYPEETFWQNTAGTLSVLNAAREAGSVKHIVYSSSAAVYGLGEISGEDATEETPLSPVSPYGDSKLLSEVALARSIIPSISLRYFNVAGSGWTDLYDSAPLNLFPAICSAMRRGEPVTLNGNQFDTPDGTAVRDYVHVMDVATAHVQALNKMRRGSEHRLDYNLGSGNGYSVKQVLDAFSMIEPVDVSIKEARPGDPARIVADATLARKELGWRPKYDLHHMVKSAWEASASMVS